MINVNFKNPSITKIYNIVSSIEPFDDLENKHIQDTLGWIQSGRPVFRIKKPDIPNKHLVSYFVLLDSEASKILLVDHKKAQRWLPPGGHVEINEDPKETVKRECLEELGVKADFGSEEPIFITSTMTVGLTSGHIDVSLWYILNGNCQTQYSFDTNEFKSIKWFKFNEIPYEKSDPHLYRFMKKLDAKSINKK